MTVQLSEPATPRPAPQSRVRRLMLGPPGDPRWARPALAAILLTATILYAWGLSRSGYANGFYSAAVKSGTQSWKALFFGSLDAGSFITVDKPPMALWVMELSARVFGFSTWSLLLPEVVMGVAAVGVLYAMVRRVFGPAAGLVAALVMTLTPITVAINRDNNPDTLLVLLLLLAAWACQRALESGRVRWLLASAFFLGCGFNTKMLQAYVLLPALALAYLAFAPGGVLRRVWHLLAAGAVLAVSSFWWMVVVDLIPAGSRPYIGGSTDGTVWDLVIGYNGLGRVTGDEGGGPGGRGGGGFSGASGPWRLFNDVLGGQTSWLLPFAALALVTGLLLYRRRPRTDLARAALVLWGGWLLVHYAVFSFADGVMHPYYTTALAPAVGALTGIGAVTLFEHRTAAWGWVLPLAIAGTGVWSFTVLRRTPSWHPWTAWTVAVLTVVAVLGLLAARFGAPARLAIVAAAAGLLAGLTGPAAYAVSAASTSTNGTNPLAGPSSGGGFGGPGLGTMRPGGGMPGGGQIPARIRQMIERGDLPGAPPNARPPGPGGAPGRGGMGGETSPQMISYLEKNQGTATWLVAVSDSQTASSIILRSGKPVISMFGFTGGDNAMTVERLQALVKAGRLRYVLTGGGGPGGGGAAVTSWVTKNCTVVEASEYGGTSSSAGALYRCGPASG